MSRHELGELDRELSCGPCLVQDALLGACVGAAIGWFQGQRGRGFFSTVTQGAGAGAGVSLLRYSYCQWLSGREHAELEKKVEKTVERVEHLTGLAPYPLYRPSTTYPWSEH